MAAGKNNIQQIDDDVLEKAVEDIVYEKIMLIESFNVINTHNGLIKNIALEAFAVHTRNLIDFFYPPQNKRNGDIFFSYYVDQKWEPSQQGFDLISYKEKCNHQLAHLTIRRVELNADPGTKSWSDADRIVKHFTEVWREFLSVLSDSKRAWFEASQAKAGIK